MTRRMADSITPTDIPVNDPQTGHPWALVAGYVDGLYVWPASGWARFPNSRHVRIAVFSSTNDGDVIDRETGDATADQAVSWVAMRRAAGHPAPTVYCSFSDWTNCQNAFIARGVPQPLWWVSGYPQPTDSAGNPIVPPGAIAHQFTDTPGGHWDESLVVDFWPGIDTSQNGDNDMTSTPVIFQAAGVVGVNGGNPLFPHGVWRDEFGVYVGLASEAERNDLIAAFPGVIVGSTGVGVWIEQATLVELVRVSRAGVDTPRLLNVTGVTVSGGVVSFTVPTHWTVTENGGGVTTVVGQA